MLQDDFLVAIETGQGLGPLSRQRVSQGQDFPVEMDFFRSRQCFGQA